MISLFAANGHLVFETTLKGENTARSQALAHHTNKISCSQCTTMLLKSPSEGDTIPGIACVEQLSRKNVLWATIPGLVFVVCVCVFTQVGMERHNTLNICHSQSSRFRGIGCSMKLVVYLEMEIDFSVVVLKCLIFFNFRRTSHHKLLYASINIPALTMS